MGLSLIVCPSCQGNPLAGELLAMTAMKSSNLELLNVSILFWNSVLFVDEAHMDFEANVN